MPEYVGSGQDYLYCRLYRTESQNAAGASADPEGGIYRFGSLFDTHPDQVQALADNVGEDCHKAGYALHQTEGYNSANWILMDYSDVIVHIFSKEDRLFYDLERIWRDGVPVDKASL